MAQNRQSTDFIVFKTNETTPAETVVKVFNNPPQSIFQFDQAIKAFNEQKYEAAMQFFNAALEVDPMMIDAYRWRSATYNKLGNTKAALDEITKMRPLREEQEAFKKNYLSKFSATIKTNETTSLTKERVAQYAFRAKKYFEAKRYKLAIWNSMLALFHSPNDTESILCYMRAVHLEKESVEYQEALNQTTFLLNQNQYQAELWILRAFFSHQLKLFDKATESLITALQMDYNQILTDQQRKEAFELIQSLEDKPSSPALSQNIKTLSRSAERQYAENKYENALNTYAHCVRLDPKNPDYYMKRGEIYERQGEWQKASNQYNFGIWVHYQQHKKVNQTSIDYHIKRRNAYIALGKVNASTSDHDNVRSLVFTLCHINPGAYSKHGKEKIDSDYSILLLQKGKELLKDDPTHITGLLCLVKAVEYYPKNIEAFLELGSRCMEFLRQQTAILSESKDPDLSSTVRIRNAIEILCGITSDSKKLPLMQLMQRLVQQASIHFRNVIKLESKNQLALDKLKELKEKFQASLQDAKDKDIQADTRTQDFVKAKLFTEAIHQRFALRSPDSPVQPKQEQKKTSSQRRREREKRKTNPSSAASHVTDLTDSALKAQPTSSTTEKMAPSQEFESTASDSVTVQPELAAQDIPEESKQRELADKITDQSKAQQPEATTVTETLVIQNDARKIWKAAKAARKERKSEEAAAEAAKKEKQRTEHALQSLKQQLTAAQEATQAATTQQDHAQKQAQLAEIEKQNIEAKLQLLRQELASIQKELATTQSAIQEAKSDNEKEKLTLQALQQQLTTAKAVLEEAHDQTAQQKTALQLLQQEFASTELIVEKSRIDKADIEMDIQTLQHTKAQLEMDILKLQQELECIQSALIQANQRPSEQLHTSTLPAHEQTSSSLVAENFPEEAPPSQPELDATIKEILNREIPLLSVEQTILSQINELKQQAYLIGGSVCDRIQTGKIDINKDSDIVTTASFEQLRQLFGIKINKVSENLFQIFDKDEKDNVIKIDIWHSEALKTSLLADALTRDFTIGALYVDHLRKTLDPTQRGLKDWLEKKIDTVLDPDISLGVDAKEQKGDRLRALRAVYKEETTECKMVPRVKASITKIPTLVKTDSDLGRFQGWLYKILAGPKGHKHFTVLLKEGMFEKLFNPNSPMVSALHKDQQWIAAQLTKTHKDIREVYIYFLVSAFMSLSKQTVSQKYKLMTDNALFHDQFLKPQDEITQNKMIKPEMSSEEFEDLFNQVKDKWKRDHQPSAKQAVTVIPVNAQDRPAEAKQSAQTAQSVAYHGKKSTPLFTSEDYQRHLYHSSLTQNGIFPVQYMPVLIFPLTQDQPTSGPQPFHRQPTFPSTPQYSPGLFRPQRQNRSQRKKSFSRRPEVSQPDLNHSTYEPKARGL